MPAIADGLTLLKYTVTVLPDWPLVTTPGLYVVSPAITEMAAPIWLIALVPFRPGAPFHQPVRFVHGGTLATYEWSNANSTMAISALTVRVR